MPNLQNGLEILENISNWKETFQSGWLAAYQQTGEVDWQQYRPPINRQTIAGPGVDLSTSRLMLITSAGAYLPDQQEPFNAADLLGDYSIRTIPATVDLKSLAYAHEHYDHKAVKADPQVLIPLEHLCDLASRGVVGELTSIISFMGYQPDVSRVIEETIPSILEHIEDELPDAVLLVPA